MSKLKEMREMCRMKQAEVAFKSEVSLRSYQYYESGARVPDVITALRIADALCIEDIRTLFQTESCD